MSAGVSIEQRIKDVVESAIDNLRDEFREELLKLKAEFATIPAHVKSLGDIKLVTKVESDVKAAESSVDADASKVEKVIETDAKDVVADVKAEVEKL